MKFSTTAAISASALAATVLADASEVEFVTVLVNDLKANQAEYIGYVATAKNVPAEVTQLALAVLTYTDESYTTLIPGLNVPQIELFAEGLPWFTRIEAALTPLAAESSAAPSSAAPAKSSAAETSSAPAPTSSAKSSSAAPASSAAPSSSVPEVTSANAAGKLVGAGVLSFGALVAALI